MTTHRRWSEQGNKTTTAVLIDRHQCSRNHSTGKRGRYAAERLGNGKISKLK